MCPDSLFGPVSILSETDVSRPKSTNLRAMIVYPGKHNVSAVGKMYFLLLGAV
jgi:hypothetical protein